MDKRTVVLLAISLLITSTISTSIPANSTAYTIETTDTNPFPYPGDDWAWQMIGTEYAHRRGEYGDDVVVAVLDTGIDYNHPDLKDKMWEDIGYDFVNDNDDPMDNDGHGTHVAGIVASVAPEAKLMALKVIEEQDGRWIEMSKAIRYARENGADIITMSFGGERSPMSRAIQIQMNFAYQQDILMVAAAGNENTDEKTYPAANDQVIGVSALDNNMDKASYSNYGDWIELSAPGGGSGGGVYSTVPDSSYSYKAGTSMACPFVTGAAALMISKNPGLTVESIRDGLREQAVDLGEPGKDPLFGYGMVNAYRAAGGRKPTPPRDFTAKGDNDKIELSWNVPWDEGDSPVEGYRMYRGTTKDSLSFYVELGAPRLNYTDDEVEEGQRYYYHITAFSDEGEGMKSDVTSASIGETIITPSEPTNVTTVMVERGVEVSWNRPQDDGGDMLTGYNVYRDTEMIASVESLEYLDEDIEAGKEYNYTVTAVNSAGEGDHSEPSKITIPDDFGSPSDDGSDDTNGTEDSGDPDGFNDTDDPLSPILPTDGDYLYPILILIFIVGIGLAVAGLAYYLSKKNKDEKTLY